MQTYHIYLNDKCLFKNLDQHEFDVIWNKLYTSYWREEITYSCITDNTKDYVSTLEESSYWHHLDIDVKYNYVMN